MTDPDPDFLRQLFAGDEPQGLSHEYLTVPQPGRMLFEGTSVPVLGLSAADVRAQPVQHLPVSVQGYAASYLILDDYKDFRQVGVTTEDVIERLLDQHDPLELLANLAILSHIASRPDDLEKLSEAYIGAWTGDTRARLRNTLRGTPGHDRIFLARQQVLAAMSRVLTTPLDDSRVPAAQVDLVAVMLTHAAGSTLDASSDDDQQQLAGTPAYLVLELVRTSLLGQTVDLFAAIDRTVRLWRDFGSRVTRGGLGQSPMSLLKEVSGLDLEEILGPAFALLARRVNGLQGDSIFDPPDLRVHMVDATREAFLALVVTDWRTLSAQLEDQDSRFGFLPFETTPVLVTDSGLLILDEDYLWARVSTGLYWIVHDYLKFKRNPGTDTNLRWNEAYAEMVELFAEDILMRLAPPILGKGTTFYSEEDLEAAYPGGKRCDGMIWFGAELMAVEVVSGRLSVPTRIEGSIDKFKADTDRLIVDKCRQLDGTAHALLDDETALTGFPQTPGLRIAPVVVVGGGYPVTPPTMNYVRQTLADENLLTDARILPLAILDLEELEMLSGLAERGHSPIDLLRQWQSSALPDIPLKHFLSRAGIWDHTQRPERMKESVDLTMQRIIDVLGIREGPAE